MKNEMKKIVVF